MAENDMDSGNAPASPNAGSSDSNSSNADAQKLQAALDNLTSRLEEVDKRTRTLQGDKDRSVSQTKKEVEELKRKFAEVEKLKGRGLNEDEAFEELELREGIRLLKQQLSGNNQAQPQAAGNGEGLTVDKAKTLQEYGLSENDADVAAVLAGKTFSNPLELENAALKIAFKRANKPQPDASAAPVVSGQPVQPVDAKQLRGNYIKEMEANRGNKAAIKAIQAKYKEQGFDTGSVGFGV